MGSLTSLNSYSSDDITYDIPDYNLIVNEGSLVELPLLTWYPVHDLGNSLSGNGVQIIHSFDIPLILMSNGMEFTIAEYNAFIAAPWQYPVLTNSNVTASTTQLKYSNRSIFFNNAPSGATTNSLRTNDVATTFVIGTGSMSLETWMYNIASTANDDYIFDTNEFEIRYKKRIFPFKFFGHDNFINSFT